MANKTSTKIQSDETAKPPVAKLRLGLMNATIWERTTDTNAFYSVTFERRYRDGEGNWHTTHSYDVNDLLTLAKLVDQAHSKIVELRASWAPSSVDRLVGELASHSTEVFRGIQHVTRSAGSLLEIRSIFEALAHLLRRVARNWYRFGHGGIRA
jgi:hypothetical protein